MKKLLFTVNLLLALNIVATCQDSTVIYYTVSGKETTKDSSHHYAIFRPQNGLWSGKCVYTKSNIVQSEGTYKKKNFETPIGKFDNYTEEGILDNTSFYETGKLKNKTFYYPSGKKRSYIEFADDGYAEEQKGWDESGNIIPGYIVMKEAEFKGGLKGWKKYLEKNLDATVPEKAGSPDGYYKVSVSFMVDKEGNIDDVKADSIPSLCKACAEEAVRVIKEGPNWEPAIYNNKPVIYRQRQTITFVLSSGRKAKKNRD